MNSGPCRVRFQHTCVYAGVILGLKPVPNGTILIRRVEVSMTIRLRFLLGFFGVLGIISLVPAAGAGSATASLPEVTCSPTPCRLPNVRISRGLIYGTAANLAINPGNPLQMILGVNDGRCPAFAAAYSTSDGGSTWTKSCLPQLDPIYADGTPVLVYDNNGMVHALTTLFNLDDGEDPSYETHSTDNGLTWSALNLAVPVVPFSFSALDHAVVDDSLGSPFAGTIYASVEQYLSSLDVKISVSRSTDGGVSWNRAIAASLSKTHGLYSEGFSHLAVGKDGTLYLAWMASPNGTFSPNSMMTAKSTDGGVTWSTPVLVYTATAVNQLPNTSIFLPDSPVIAVDTSGGAFSGRLYMTFFNFTGAFMQVLVTQSADGGSTWSTPVPVAPPTATRDQFLPWISVGPDGSASVTWLDRRDDPANVSYRTYLAFSKDGGVSWGRNIPLAKAMSQPTNGDHFAVNAWVGSTLFAVWPSMKTGGSLQEVLGGFIP